MAKIIKITKIAEIAEIAKIAKIAEIAEIAARVFIARFRLRKAAGRGSPALRQMRATTRLRPH